MDNRCSLWRGQEAIYLCPDLQSSTASESKEPGSLKCCLSCPLKVWQNFPWQEQFLWAAQSTTWLWLHFCRSVFILIFCCWRLVLPHTCYSCVILDSVILHSSWFPFTKSLCLPCSLLDDLWRFLTIPDHWTTSCHPDCSDFLPQLLLGHAIGFSSGLEGPHSAAISPSTLVILIT